MAIGSNLDPALRLLDHGFIPIPLHGTSSHIAFHALGLRPYHLTSADHRLKDLAYRSVTFHLAMQPPDRAEVTRWFSAHDVNIGVIGGYEGLTVLDFDEEPVFDLWARRYPAIAGSTPVEKSPRGYHVFLRCGEPLRCTSLYLGRRKGGHVTGLGGYVACTPSSFSQQRSYRWLDGRSPFDVAPAPVRNLTSIGIYRSGFVRRFADRLIVREPFEPR